MFFPAADLVAGMLSMDDDGKHQIPNSNSESLREQATKEALQIPSFNSIERAVWVLRLGASLDFGSEPDWHLGIW